MHGAFPSGNHGVKKTFGSRDDACEFCIAARETFGLKPQLMSVLSGAQQYIVGVEVTGHIGIADEI